MQIEDPSVIERLDYTNMPKQAIQGTPWYSLLSNPEYTEDFYYFGAHVAEREKFIKDDDYIEENDHEQSDMIIILLNLGSVPDSVA